MRYIKKLLIGALLCLASAHASTGEVNLVTVDYAPFYGPTLPNEGPITEIVTAAFKNVGYQVNVKYVPWARAVADAKAGKADGLHGAWFSKEREEWFVYSDKLPGNEIVLFKRKGTEPEAFIGYDDLQPYKIGVVRGYVNPPEFDAADLRTEEANSDKLNLTKLAKGRVDLILIDRAIAKYMLANELAEYKDALEAIDPPLKIEHLYMLISKETDDYQTKLDDFNKGLKTLTEEGGVDEIMKRHNLQ
jgi:polar amino acid transport system substrate-binding protein